MSTLRANTSFNVGTLIVHRGDLVDSKSSIVKGREHLFEPVEVSVLSSGALETASAKPGARRKRGKPAPTPKAAPDAGVETPDADPADVPDGDDQADTDGDDDQEPADDEPAGADAPPAK